MTIFAYFKMEEPILEPRRKRNPLVIGESLIYTDGMSASLFFELSSFAHLAACVQIIRSSRRYHGNLLWLLFCAFCSGSPDHRRSAGRWFCGIQERKYKSFAADDEGKSHCTRGYNCDHVGQFRWVSRFVQYWRREWSVQWVFTR